MVVADFFTGSAIFLVVLLIIAIWIFVEINKFKHKFFGLFLILLILFIYVSSVSVFNDNGVDFTTAEGVLEAGKIYFSWIGSVFANIREITTDAINLDWSRNITTDNKRK